MQRKVYCCGKFPYTLEYLNIIELSSNPKYSQNFANKEAVNDAKVLKEDMLFI